MSHVGKVLNQAQASAMKKKEDIFFFLLPRMKKRNIWYEWIDAIQVEADPTMKNGPRILYFDSNYSGNSFLPAPINCTAARRMATDSIYLLIWPSSIKNVIVDVVNVH